MPVGGEALRHTRARVIAASNRDLKAAVKTGRFREDLFYRLNVIPLLLPPLRARTSDIPLLVEHFVRKHAGSRPRRVADKALQALMGYPWPGNVRELEAIIERALLLGEGDTLETEDLPSVVCAGAAQVQGAFGLEIPESGIDLEAVERSLILKAIQKAAGNVSRAARLLGLSRRTLQYRLDKIQGAPDGALTARKGADSA